MEGHRRSGGLAQLAMENGKGLEFRGLGFKGLGGFGVLGLGVLGFRGFRASRE